MKQQIFIDDIHEYDYELIDDCHTLLYNGENWNSNMLNSEAICLVDDGNGLVIRFDSLGTNAISIDYDEAERLFLILKLAMQPAKYEIATKKLL
jgi:hypothetical protein